MTAAPSDRDRVRTVLRLLAVGGVAAVLLAALVGILGGSGAAGAAVLLLVLAAACGLAALHAVATLLYDDLKDRHPSRLRAVLAAGLFVLAAVLMALVAGVGG